MADPFYTVYCTSGAKYILKFDAEMDRVGVGVGRTASISRQQLLELQSDAVYVRRRCFSEVTSAAVLCRQQTSRRRERVQFAATHVLGRHCFHSTHTRCITLLYGQLQLANKQVHNSQMFAGIHAQLS